MKAKGNTSGDECVQHRQDVTFGVEEERVVVEREIADAAVSVKINDFLSA